MTFVQSLSRLFGGVGPTGYRAQGVYAPASPLLEDKLSAITTYRVLRALYDNNGLYEDLSYILATRGLWKESLQPLRNPANRVVEFYASKTCPGAKLEEALPIEAKSQAVTDAIMKVWRWSNWGAKKQVAVRWNAIYGDLFIKVVGRQDPARVFYQLLAPETTTEIEQDERGYLTHIRMDIPVLRVDRKTGLKNVPRMVTEIWDKDTDSLRMWEHDFGPGTDVSQLGTPFQNVSIIEKFQVNFIPIVQGKFRDTGEARGAGAFQHAFDKINEANRQATRLHQLLFRHNNVTFAINAGGLDPSGRPIPAPMVEIDGVVATSELPIGDDRFLSLPGNATLEPLVPNLNYAAALDILNAQMQEIQRDLPEMAYFDLREMGGQISGRAVRTLLGDAIDRCLEFRGNFEDALARADMMALTIGQLTGALPGLAGSFEEGSWEHSFTERPVFPIDDLEQAEADNMEATAGMAWHEIGVSKRELLRQKGYTDAQIQQMEGEIAKEQEDLAANMMDQFNRGAVPGNRASNANLN